MVQAWFLGNANYRPSVEAYVATVSVQAGTQGTIAWDAWPPASPRVGVDSSALGAPASDPAGATFSYTSSSGCSIDSNTRVISYTTVDDCTITAHAAQTGYVEKTQDFTVSSVGIGDQSPPSSSSAYGTSATLRANGSGILPTEVLTGHGALEYQIKTGSETYCSINASTGEVTANTAGIGNVCEVQARFAGNTNYNPSNYGDIGSITIIEGSQTPIAASDVYGASPTVSRGSTLDVVTEPTGGQGALEYRSGMAGNGACSVDTTTGQITGSLNGNCVVEARWAGNTNYDASDWSVVQTITVGAGLLSIDTLPSFTGTLAVGGSLTPSAPVSTPAGTASYALADGETNCTLDSASTGQVTGSSVVVLPGETTCSLVVTVTATNYAPVTAPLAVDLSVRLWFSPAICPRATRRRSWHFPEEIWKWVSFPLPMIIQLMSLGVSVPREPQRECAQ